MPLKKKKRKKKIIRGALGWPQKTILGSKVLKGIQLNRRIIPFESISYGKRRVLPKAQKPAKRELYTGPAIERKNKHSE